MTISHSKKSNPESFSKKNLTVAVLARLLASIPMLGLLFFLPAGTLAYWESLGIHGNTVHPDHAGCRLPAEKRPRPAGTQVANAGGTDSAKVDRRFVQPVPFAHLRAPGFDKRFGWSATPAWLVLFAVLIVLLGYGIFFLVLRENSYASRTVGVEQGQRVISSGPYAVVRHPMYLGLLLMYGFSPLALGSYWGMIPMLLLPVLLMARIQNEEQVLRKELEGYEAYTRQVKYKLIPGIW